MPIYEYECLECRGRFERRQSVKDESIKVCVKCGGQARRVLHPVGIIFKGSGFYATDSRKPHYGEGAKPADESKSEKKDATETATAEAKSTKQETKVGAGSTASSE